MHQRQMSVVQLVVDFANLSIEWDPYYYYFFYKRVKAKSSFIVSLGAAHRLKL
jgi:hypothetical protein